MPYIQENDFYVVFFHVMTHHDAHRHHTRSTASTKHHKHTISPHVSSPVALPFPDTHTHSHVHIQEVIQDVMKPVYVDRIVYKDRIVEKEILQEVQVEVEIEKITYVNQMVSARELPFVTIF